MTQCAAASLREEPVEAGRPAMQEKVTPSRPPDRFIILLIMRESTHPAKAAPHAFITCRSTDNLPDSLLLERLILVGVII